MISNSVESQQLTDNFYEGMFLLDSGKYAADADGSTAALMGILDRCGAKVEAHRAWQDGKLAYPVEGQRKGLHYLIYFRMEPSRLGEIAHLCKLSELVLRHMVIKQPEELFNVMVDALKSDEGRGTAAEPHDSRDHSRGRPRRFGDDDEGRDSPRGGRSRNSEDTSDDDDDGDDNDDD